jgi:hypothetical protein
MSQDNGFRRECHRVSYPTVIRADRGHEPPAIFPLSGSGAALILPLPLKPEQSGTAARRGVLAQLVERLNGIEEVRGSNPLGSTSL